MQHVLLCFCRSVSEAQGLASPPVADRQVGLVQAVHRARPLLPLQPSLSPVYSPILLGADALPNPAAIPKRPSVPRKEYLLAILGFSGSQICQMSPCFPLHRHQSHRSLVATGDASCIFVFRGSWDYFGSCVNVLLSFLVLLSSCSVCHYVDLGRSEN